MLPGGLEKRVAYDVDQTLAGGVVPAHIYFYNQELGLGMSPEEIRNTEDYDKTFDVPQIIEFREKDEARFQEVRNFIRTSPEVHMQLSTIPGSREAIQWLHNAAGLKHGGYYSVRPCVLGRCTKDWLEQQEFPNPELTTICQTPQDKLEKICHDHLVGDNNRNVQAILIDDSTKDLVDAAGQIVEKQPELSEAIKRLVIVGFGPGASLAEKLKGPFHKQTGAHLLSLPDWERSSLGQLRLGLVLLR